MTNYPVTLADGYKANRKTLVFAYDFAVNGGAVGTVVLGPDTIPAGWYVTSLIAVGETDLASGGSATVALGANADGDLKAANAFTNYVADVAVNQSPTSSPKKTSASGLRFTVAGATLTGGKVKFFVEIEKLAA